MPRDINQRLGSLKTRRRGTDRTYQVTMDSARQILAKSLLPESYEQREPTRPHTRYALGAMQEVDPDYTRISIETAERVGRQLDQALAAAGCPVGFRLQGSVPLNIHIRGVSDVDLLTLSQHFLTYDVNGSAAQAGQYGSPGTRTAVMVLQEIRHQTEETLKDKYPAATVDRSGSKAVKISGGSLARPVDVVPSHWHDTTAYQASQNERDRAVTILDCKAHKTLDNYPFLHIALVDERDLRTVGGLKKAIRLCKNVRSDADTDIKLPGFDIASLMYHANQTALTAGCYYELAVLAEAQRHLDFLYHNEAYARELRVPDGSRCILDTTDKLTAMKQLSYELDELLRQVAIEMRNTILASAGPLSLDESRNVVNARRLSQ